MCPAVIVVVIAVMAILGPLHIGLVIHIFILFSIFSVSTMLLLFLERGKSSREGRKSYLSGVYVPVEGGILGGVCVCVCVWYGCVADRPLDKCYML